MADPFTLENLGWDNKLYGFLFRVPSHRSGLLYWPFAKVSEVQMEGQGRQPG